MKLILKNLEFWSGIFIYDNFYRIIFFLIKISGPYSAGKSTFINAIIGQDILPS